MDPCKLKGLQIVGFPAEVKGVMTVDSQNQEALSVEKNLASSGGWGSVSAGFPRFVLFHSAPRD